MAEGIAPPTWSQDFLASVMVNWLYEFISEISVLELQISVSSMKSTSDVTHPPLANSRYLTDKVGFLYQF